jgi:hypothetical protein
MGLNPEAAAAVELRHQALVVLVKSSSQYSMQYNKCP